MRTLCLGYLLRFESKPMPHPITATELRRNVYQLLDQVLETGRPLEVERHGRRLVIEPAERRARLDRLEPHPGCIAVDPESLVHMDWSDQWKPGI